MDVSEYERVPESLAGDERSGPLAPGVAPPAPTHASALDELESLAERDLVEHPDVYQRIHSELQSALAAIDNA